MRYECGFNPKLNIIEASTHGPADMAALLEMVRRIVELSGKENSANVLIDHSGIDASSLTMQNVQTLSDTSVSLKDLFKMEKCAQIAANDLQFGFARAWEMMVESDGLTGVETRVFRNREAAIEWVKAGSGSA